MMMDRNLLTVLSRAFLILSIIVALFAACSRENYPDDKPDVPKVDTTAPVIKVLHANVDITGVEEITIRSNALYIGDLLIATWSDNVTQNCRVSMTINGNNITSGSVPIVSGTLTLTVTDDAGNASTATIKLTMKETHPDITIYHTEVNVFGGVQLSISYDHLTIDGELVMAWSDKTTSQCKVVVSQGDRELKDGDMLSKVGMLKVVVTNGQGKSSTGEIELVSNPIEGLDNLRAADLQVGKETDLLDGLTFVNGATLIKTEIEMDGKRSTIDDATHFTPELPGQCNIIFTVQGQDGTTTQVVAENLTIKPMEYNEPTIATADMINTHYPWFYVKEHIEDRQFIYPYLLISYAACNHSSLPNRINIIQGETADGVDENIGISSQSSEHGNCVYEKYRHICPNAIIKGCYGRWEHLDNYLNEHPDGFYFVSCSKDWIFGKSLEELRRHPDLQYYRKVLDNKNVVVSQAAMNKGKYDNEVLYKVYNEEVKDGDYYNEASINSKYHNKIAAIGYSPRKNYFSSNTSIGNESLLPVGFYTENGCFAMPMISTITNGFDDVSTKSSWPAPMVCGAIGNAVAVIMMNRPELETPVDAMDIIVDRYLRMEKLMFTEDTVWSANPTLIEAENSPAYFIKTQELMDNELLQAEKLERLTLNGDDVELPFGRGICYLGKGVQFELDGERHDIGDVAALTEALKAGNAKWYWNRRAFRRYGDADTVDLHVYVVDKNGEKFPDLELNIIKPVN